VLKWIITTCLGLMALGATTCIFIANLAPFTTNAWLNSLILSGSVFLAIFAALLVAVFALDSDDYEFYFACVVVVGFILAFIGGIVTGTNTESASSAVRTIAWSGYGAGLVAYIVSSLIYFLVCDFTE
jgi:VIT1/CCC1 family predicted Fe2+/Mn2+ transporter